MNKNIDSDHNSRNSILYKHITSVIKLEKKIYIYILELFDRLSRRRPKASAHCSFRGWLDLPSYGLCVLASSLLTCQGKTCAFIYWDMHVLTRSLCM
jgi:hypothetical protein